MLEKLLKDKVILKKDNGQTVEDIKARVLSNNIFIADTSLPIEKGDRLIRNLPNGLVETYIIENLGYCKGALSITAHYQVAVRKEEAAGT